MQPGDLVRADKQQAMGVVVEIFDELDPNNPWIRVLFTHPKETYQWVKMNGLKVVSKKKGEAPSLVLVAESGSL